MTDMNKEASYSTKPEFTSGDDIPTIVANDSLSLAGSLPGRRRINRVHNQRRNTGKIIWNDETKQVEIQDETSVQTPSNEGVNSKSIQLASKINSRGLISRFQNTTKQSMPPIPRVNRSRNQAVTKKVLTVANSTSAIEPSPKEGNDELTMIKLYDDIKIIIDQLTDKVHRLEKDLRERDHVIEKLKKFQYVESSLDRQDKEVYEQKISELAEELKKIESIKADNIRLKEENAALIRVITKLSK